MRIPTLFVALLAVGFGFSEASAQVPWDAPLMVGPASPGGFSILLADPGHNAGIGAFVHWKGSGQRSRLGYRIGLAEEHRGPDREDRLAVYGGVDFSAPLYSHTVDFPLDMVWVAGVGAGFGDDALVSIPFGISFGRGLTTEGVWVHPYVTPRMIVDAYFGNDNGDDLDLDFAVDLGVDFAFSDHWALRFGGSIGDGHEGLAVGVALPTGY